jgi:N-acetylglucosaminyldiphosphoundecaprenol N-acetyl-beta-D-mannosaminyltransferase
MEDWVEQRQRGRWIAVTSSHGVVEGHKHPAFKAILKSADVSVPDGIWTARVAARLAGKEARQVRGADLLETFCELSSRKGYSNFFLGDTEDVLALLARRLLLRFPTLKISGTCSPPFGPLTTEEDERIVQHINQASPDVLWVGLGLPKQERWIFSHRDKLKVPVVVAVGAAFKFVSGKVKPAPRWISESGLEWVWRFAHEPRRLWHRVVVYGPQFAALTLLELAGLRKYHH